jgi:hypothetical protein
MPPFKQKNNIPKLQVRIEGVFQIRMSAANAEMGI